MRFGVLGPLVAEDERGLVDLQGPRHRAVLARLLIARARVVPVHTLVDDLWQRPPDGAVGAIQTFVGALRRVLEPDRPPRAPARLLVTEAPGYALRAEDVDAWRFEEAVTEAGRLLARSRAAAALSQVDDALARWRGPAYAEFADQHWARAEISRLDELGLLAVERRAQALLELGRAAEAVPDLEAHVDVHPWREDAWRLLALARYRAGRQGDALETLRRARQVLVAELGVDPGSELRELESDILEQAPRLNAVEAPKHSLVARSEELGQLAQVAARPRPGLVLIAGEAGAGKTALATAFAEQLQTQGWTTVWGDNPDHEGLPAAWPWTRILDSLPGPAPVPEPGEDPAAARFRWHRAVAEWLAVHAPLLVVLDDLHWAGEETLALLASVVSERAVLIVGTYRTTDISPQLAALLGRVARAEPTRIYLSGLPQTAVADLVRATTGQQVDAATAAAIHQRSGGNPFYIRELARLLDAGGELSSVPAGVRDVVRYRVAELPEPVPELLRQAAVIGTEFDLELLPGDALDAVEMAVRKGLLVERGPRRFQFAHALVRDTLYQDLSRSRRARRHEAVGQAIERLRPDDVETLAHHFALAESPRAAGYARAAAEQAERQFAMHEAARWWAAALAHDHSGDVRERLELIMGSVRALAVTGALSEARQHRAEALTLAGQLGDSALTARVLSAFDVPAIWTENDAPALAARIVALAERVLPETTGATRARLLATLALELRNTGGERARAAAREAETIARGLNDPAALAFALNARFMQSFERAGLAPERARIGAELVELAQRNSLVGFEVLGHLILLQAHSALAEFTEADRHATAVDRLGEDYRIPLAGVFTQWYRALRTAVAGQPAEAAYRAAAARLSGSGMSGLDNGILAFALYCDQVRRGLPPDLDADFGVYTDWCRPGESIPDSPRDLLYEARTCLQAMHAIERGDVSTMERLYDELLPAAGELAGAGSGLLTLRPVAHYLAELAVALGRDPAA
ncbi:BTAD domain-containing putative transcriptional regulator [Amycolatopsis sp.]|uniref:BTAD domain-containing putative transcriptional regulator n=1 Tax=Amycolatopsis sp. TaxID=37632 RepID=UPI002D170146|nr:BTAD domain-containing putative transcriptional regulator [Amycolatopsis sp.]HVV13179.1 BTAD domain-containing putative transcriptional regulator [Amycolatopsis sp.]